VKAKPVGGGSSSPVYDTVRQGLAESMFETAKQALRDEQQRRRSQALRTGFAPAPAEEPKKENPWLGALKSLGGGLLSIPATGADIVAKPFEAIPGFPDVNPEDIGSFNFFVQGGKSLQHVYGDAKELGRSIITGKDTLSQSPTAQAYQAAGGGLTGALAAAGPYLDLASVVAPVAMGAARGAGLVAPKAVPYKPLTNADIPATPYRTTRNALAEDMAQAQALRSALTGYRTDHTKWWDVAKHRDYEVNELGNKFANVDDYPNYEGIWVTLDPRDAARYGDDIREVDLSGATSIFDDGDGGFFYVRPRHSAPTPEVTAPQTGRTMNPVEELAQAQAQLMTPDELGQLARTINADAQITGGQNKGLSYFWGGEPMINDRLRGDYLGDAFDAEIAEAQAFFQRVPPLQQPVKVFRGIMVEEPEAGTNAYSDFVRTWKPGDVIEEPGFMSTTIDRKIAEGYSNAGRILEIEVPKGTRVATPEMFGDAYKSIEQELTLPPNTKLQITSVSNDVIKARVVPSDTPTTNRQAVRDALLRYVDPERG